MCTSWCVRWIWFGESYGFIFVRFSVSMRVQILCNVCERCVLRASENAIVCDDILWPVRFWVDQIPIAAGSRWYATEPFLCTSVSRTLSVMCTCEDFSVTVRRRRRDSRFVTAVRASRLWEIVLSLHRHTHKVFCVRIESSSRNCSASRSCSARSRSARICSASRSCSTRSCFAGWLPHLRNMTWLRCNPSECMPHSLHTYWELRPRSWSPRSRTDDHH